MRHFPRASIGFAMLLCAAVCAAAQSDSPGQAPSSSPAVPGAPVASSPVANPPVANPPAANTPVDAPQGEGDRFQGLRDIAASARESYSALHRQSMPEIDRLLKTRRCQINRIGGLLDRVSDKMHEWSQAELTYWTKWGEIEEVRVTDERKKLAIMETDQQRTQEVMDTETRDREELLRKKANLEKYGKRSQDVIQQVDALVQEIRDSETRLAEAKAKFDDITIRVKNMDTLITARLVQIRQYRADVETMVLKQTSEYDNLRTEAQEMCNTKKPVTRKSASASQSN